MYTYMKIIPYFIIIIILYDIQSHIHLCINIVTSYFCVIEILILLAPFAVLRFVLAFGFIVSQGFNYTKKQGFRVWRYSAEIVR